MKHFTKLKQITKALLLTTMITIGIGSVSHAEWVTVEASAYTNEGGITASGIAPYEGIIAADDLPIGTVVRINGYPYVVQDRFGGGYSNRIDIYFDTYEECINFGRKYMDVYIER